MKRILIVFLLFSFGCSSDRDKIETIEFMSYRWDLKYPTEFEGGKFYIQPKLYSIFDLNGENKSYICEFSPNKKETYFNSKIDKVIIDELVRKLAVIEDSAQIPVDNYSVDGCVENAPSLRLKIVYKNKKVKSYLYNFKRSNSADLFVKKLYVALNAEFIDGKFKKSADSVFLNRKKQAFIEFSIDKDTSILPLPALPKYNKVKFTK